MKRWLIVLSLLCSVAFADDVRVNEAGQIEARGSDVRVFRGDATEPLFGSVVRARDSVRFAAALPLVPGDTYRVEFQTADGIWSTQRLKFAHPASAAPTVAIAPSPTVLPANALKLYLQFSQPMEQGVFLDRITLQGQDGSVVQGAFRETELWSPDGKRLTLWLHPGRQKSGVNLNTDEGPVLQENTQHTLRIAANWRSASGVGLGKETVFTVSAGAADHSCPDPQRWQITVPKAGARDPLIVSFDEPLDAAMLVSSLKVKRGEGEVAGVVTVAADARTWSFTPDAEWTLGAGVLEIDPLLEDLAGNNLLGPFEVDHDAPAKAAKATALAFEVGG
ncbi:Ig-like domain-containing protein [Prosthecobacter sp.]|uniref:Ig-like domain-containing protein n=1 Tax=Prosthecobacter sp. TaxID=1965333 RepID=UPI00248A3CD4|nr:Ig-like domain-containing protein [Prosthecobacter sp.]MDI1311971.1 Ig-like domain-containing protein [Prosthecobacter sp.]